MSADEGKPPRFRYFLYDNNARVFTEIKDGFVCGRAEGDLQFPDDDVVSRRHCKFSVQLNDVYIEDFKPTNSTLVNTVPLRPGKKRRLQLNDVIEFGSQRLILTNQDKFAPANIQDGSHRPILYKGWIRPDGSMTSEVSRTLTRTALIMDKLPFQKLKFKEAFRAKPDQVEQLKHSRILPLILLMGWLALGSWFYSEGAFTEGLKYPVLPLALQLTVMALVFTGIAEVADLVAVNRVYRTEVGRAAFNSVSVAALLALSAYGAQELALPQRIGENLHELHCVKAPSDKCPRYRPFGPKAPAAPEQVPAPGPSA
jgi:hypothetical protein